MFFGSQSHLLGAIVSLGIVCKCGVIYEDMVLIVMLKKLGLNTFALFQLSTSVSAHRLASLFPPVLGHSIGGCAFRLTCCVIICLVVLGL
jgi:hypothetical protein